MGTEVGQWRAVLTSWLEPGQTFHTTDALRVVGIEVGQPILIFHDERMHAELRALGCRRHGAQHHWVAP